MIYRVLGGKTPNVAGSKPGCLAAAAGEGAGAGGGRATLWHLEPLGAGCSFIVACPGTQGDNWPGSRPCSPSPRLVYRRSNNLKVPHLALLPSNPINSPTLDRKNGRPDRRLQHCGSRRAALQQRWPGGSQELHRRPPGAAAAGECVHSWVGGRWQRSPRSPRSCPNMVLLQAVRAQRNFVVKAETTEGQVDVNEIVADLQEKVSGGGVWQQRLWGRRRRPPAHDDLATLPRPQRLPPSQLAS